MIKDNCLYLTHNFGMVILWFFEHFLFILKKSAIIFLETRVHICKKIGGKSL